MRETLGFAAGAAGMALAGLFAAVAAAGAPGWAAAGWAVVAVPAVASGSRLAFLHGRADTRFVVVMGAGLLARLLGAGAVTVTAARTGGEALPAALLGLALGFLPVGIFEAVWFARRGAMRKLEGGRP